MNIWDMSVWDMDKFIHSRIPWWGGYAVVLTFWAVYFSYMKLKRK